MIDATQGLPTVPTPRAPAEPAAFPDDAGARRAAVAFEAAFLAEMLSHAQLGKTPEGFGGGAGEDAFGGMLVTRHAETLAESGGIGLAEAIFRSLTAEETGR